MYLLDRMGVFDHYNYFTSISFTNTTYPGILFKAAENVQLLPLKYAKLPTYDCGTERWSKKGLFVDTTKTDHKVSRICKDLNKYADAGISNKTINSFYQLENKSRRIVLYDNKKNELVFYLSYLHGKWYLTIVDHVSSDCSA